MSKKKHNLKDKPLLKMLLANKGYTLIHEGEQGSDIYLAIDPQTGAICLLMASEGSQYFKEIVLADEQVDYMFALVEGRLDKLNEFPAPKTRLGKHLINREDFIALNTLEKEVGKEINKTNEALIRNLKEEQVLSLARVAYINEFLTDVTIVNLTYQEVHTICAYLVELAKKAQAEAETMAQQAAEELTKQRLESEKGEK